MKTLIQKLITVQSGLKAPKSQRNSFGNYNYRKAEDILEAAKPILKEQGLLLSLSDEVELIGNRFYIKVTASITDGENTHSVTALAREEESKKGMDGSQVTGASSSYARKYALNGLFAIDDTADSDQTNVGDGEAKTQPKQQQQTPKPAPTPTPAAPQKSTTPILLISGNEVEWSKVIAGLKSKGKTLNDWSAIKKSYIITPNDEALLFTQLGWK